MAYMDANGDAEGNYTLIGRLADPAAPGGWGLYPVGTLTRKKHNDSALPVSPFHTLALTAHRTMVWSEPDP